MNVFTYIGELVNIFLPMKTPLSCDRLGFDIGISVAIPPSYHISFIICYW
ncbi:MAG: hypothetical protein UGE22_06180 [Clostridia bacterium]|nr:hypothetical protein [Clostridia bacterium]